MQISSFPILLVSYPVQTFSRQHFLFLSFRLRLVVLRLLALAISERIYEGEKCALKIELIKKSVLRLVCDYVTVGFEPLCCTPNLQNLCQLDDALGDYRPSGSEYSTQIFLKHKILFKRKIFFQRKIYFNFDLNLDEINGAGRFTFRRISYFCLSPQTHFC